MLNRVSQAMEGHSRVKIGVMPIRAGIQLGADLVETRHPGLRSILDNGKYALSLRCLDFVYGPD